MNGHNSTKKRLAVELVDRLFMVSVFLQRTGNRQVARWGLNQSQFTVLVEIAKNTDIAQKDILGRLLLEKSNLSKIIGKLEKMGLISVRIQESDKRQSVLNATEKGRGQVRDCMSELDELKEAFVAPLKVSKLRELLSAINDLEKLVSYHQKKHTATLRRGT